MLFRALLDLSYINFVNPLYSYSGFEYSFNYSSYIVSWIIFVICSVISPYIFQKVSDYFIASFLLTIIAPLSSIFGLSDNGLLPFIVTVSVFVFFKATQYGSLGSLFLPIPNIKIVLNGRGLVLGLSMCSVVFLILWYFLSGAVRYFNLDLSKVYEYRSASADLANIGVMAYFNSWVYNVFSIFLMCYFLAKKKYSFFALLLLVQVFFSGVSAHKSLLFYPIMILGVWFYFRRSVGMALMPIGFSFIVGGCLILYLYFDYGFAGSLFIRRVFFVPAKLTLDYFHFFSMNDFIWWSNSILANYVDYPYNLRLTKLIGEFNGDESSANNGFISSGYAHAGLLGVVIYSLIFSYFLKLLDSVALDSDVPVWLALCITIVPLRSALISSDLFTTLLTHGLALSLLIVILFRSSKYSKQGFS